MHTRVGLPTVFTRYRHIHCTLPNRIIYSKSHTHPQHVKCALPSIPRLHSPSLRMSMACEVFIEARPPSGNAWYMLCGYDALCACVLSHIIVSRIYGRALNHRGQKWSGVGDARLIRPIACRRQKAGWPIPPFQPYHTVYSPRTPALSYVGRKLVEKQVLRPRSRLFPLTLFWRRHSSQVYGSDQRSVYSFASHILAQGERHEGQACPRYCYVCSVRSLKVIHRIAAS